MLTRLLQQFLPKIKSKFSLRDKALCTSPCLSEAYLLSFPSDLGCQIAVLLRFPPVIYSNGQDRWQTDLCLNLGSPTYQLHDLEPCLEHPANLVPLTEVYSLRLRTWSSLERPCWLLNAFSVLTVPFLASAPTAVGTFLSVLIASVYDFLKSIPLGTD